MATSNPPPTSPPTKQTACIQRHLKDLQDNPLPFISNLQLSVTENLQHLTGVMTGPDGTDYAGRQYEFVIQFNSPYPFKAPDFCFRTPIIHPNVDASTGTACNDHMLAEWAPNFTLSQLLTEMHNLLAHPNYASPIQSTPGTVPTASNTSA